jgi:hypothetical protein
MKNTVVSCIVLIVGAVVAVTWVETKWVAYVLIPLLTSFVGAVIGSRICLWDIRREQFTSLIAQASTCVQKIVDHVVSVAYDTAFEESLRIDRIGHELKSLGHNDAGYKVLNLYLDIKSEIYSVRNNSREGCHPLITPEMEKKWHELLEEQRPDNTALWRL